MTCTLPPLPGPAVELAICAPPSTIRPPALTVTEPPVPDCGPVAEAAIWVLGPRPVEHQQAGRCHWTEPPAPAPAVVLTISPPLFKLVCGASR